MTSDSVPSGSAGTPAGPDAPGDTGTPDNTDASGTTDTSALLALQRATHATLQVLAAELAGLGLTPSEINALANLADGRARTASELGAAVGTRPTTLTGVLDRLEQRGHITRGTRAGDRRSVLVELTASGRQAADTVRRTVAGLERRALRDLTPAQVDGFHTVLLALTKASA